MIELKNIEAAHPEWITPDSPTQRVGNKLLVFGTDEETLWRCMGRYNQLEEQATLGFAPDSSFPLTYAEKGLLQLKLKGPGSDTIELEAGQAFNVVPAKASYSGSLLESVVAGLKDLGYEYEQTAKEVTVIGLPKHAKDAAQGINAIIRTITVTPMPSMEKKDTCRAASGRFWAAVDRKSVV